MSEVKEPLSPANPLVAFVNRHPTAMKVVLGILFYVTLFGKVVEAPLDGTEHDPKFYMGVWVFGFINLAGDHPPYCFTPCDVDYTGYGYQWAMNRLIVAINLRNPD